MEEAGQILEVETLIPMLLQVWILCRVNTLLVILTSLPISISKDVDLVDGCRLKRVVLIGDHLQVYFILIVDFVDIDWS